MRWLRVIAARSSEKGTLNRAARNYVMSLRADETHESLLTA